MKALIVSDLHYDFWSAVGRDPLEDCMDVLEGVEAVILAGDLTNKGRKRWPRVFDYIQGKIPGVSIYALAGNHDFYGQTIDDEDKLRLVAQDCHVHYAQEAEFTLGASRVFCTTLWTDFQLPPGRLRNEHAAIEKSNDFHAIRVASDGYRKLRPSDVVSRHLQHRRWLEERLATPASESMKTVVVTHHAPHPGVLPASLGDVRAAYASDLTALFEKYDINLWLHGHEHHAQPLNVGRTRVRSVSLGYPPQVSAPRDRIVNCIFAL
ncbi:metallophosphoesterase [Tranquillimonas alkanivorans]|uniref:Calcineurin-like phosphoesterase n=1 Tax=Tranquillimonas alkanivorans TaxID=441119 RepID=A0A1I5W225_9RHOB|nr:metallophosphoesterase [Tranquillimonas alkanivorans]SFQ13785.1 Calcineurin-like phosphoesterase [Tranquillimonas alkanivorans]